MEGKELRGSNMIRQTKKIPKETLPTKPRYIRVWPQAVKKGFASSRPQNMRNLHLIVLALREDRQAGKKGGKGERIIRLPLFLLPTHISCFSHLGRRPTYVHECMRGRMGDAKAVVWRRKPHLLVPGILCIKCSSPAAEIDQ